MNNNELNGQNPKASNDQPMNNQNNLDILNIKPINNIAINNQSIEVNTNQLVNDSNNNINTTNNNDLNTQNNEINIKPINNMNNKDNNEDINNQKDSYNGLTTNHDEPPKKKINIKLLAIIAAIIIFIVVLLTFIPKIFNNSLKTSKAKNTTGLTVYTDSDVDNNCTYEQTEDNKKIKLYLDLIFNYKSKSNSGNQINYQLRLYSKEIIEYENGLTDNEYKEFINSLDSMKCISFQGDDVCTEDHLELGITETGWDTVVDRKGNKIEMTYYNIYGTGKTATEKEIKETLERYENNGYICN